VGGVIPLFGGEESLARRVVAACRHCGWDVRVAIADTAGAAWAVARFETGVSDAHEANADAEPTGASWYTLVPPGGGEVLDRLPVAALRLPERTEQQLARLGIARLGQLRRLPRGSLATRFGASLVRSLDQLEGTAAEVIVSQPTTPDWQVQWLFESPTTHRETLEHVLRQLLTRLAQQLVQQQQGVLQLECRLVCPHRPPLILSVGLFQPATDPQHWMSLLQLQLDRLTLPDVVEEIRVVATATAPLERRQAELFACPTPGDPKKLTAFIERVSSRLGRQRVVRPQLQAEAQVELAYRCVPLAGGELSVARPSRKVAASLRDTEPSCGATRPQNVVAPTSTGAITEVGSGRRTEPGPGGPTASAPLRPLLRPLWLWDPPQPIDVVGLALDGPPALFHYEGRPYRVARSFGPERIETGWWRGPSSRRDYYRVETESGQRLWLFRRLPDQQWFLHGVFE
jgi:protein ImuB